MESKHTKGDRHPDHNMLIFLEYDADGKEVWTSDPRLSPEYKPNKEN